MNSIITPSWEDYELVQSGDSKRLERFGSYYVVRPDPTVLWPLPKSPRPEWKTAEGIYEEGEWYRSSMPEDWMVAFDGVKLRLRPTPFRHVGIFPEQATNWKWVSEAVATAVRKGKKPRVLNLFAYTGGASIAAAQAGAEVTHVDASRGTVFWASENARLSGLPEDAIRWIVDDVSKFVAREVRRGAKYDIVLLDPPVFGRGSKGEIWRLADSLPPLLEDIAALLTEEPSGFLLNFYATELYPEAIARLVRSLIPIEGLTLSSLSLAESEGENVLQTGYMLRS